MGGDYGPSCVVPGVNLAFRERPDTHFILYGDRNKIEEHLDKFPDLKKNTSIHHTEDYVSSNEKPSNALRTGQNSSMRLSIDAVRDKTAQGIVSGGNTGALMAMAKMVLKCLPGIHRPAIASVFPAAKGKTVMLDLGANLVSDPENLSQFAVLGAVYARLINGIGEPTVGILNVGSEDMKGHDSLREAAAILANVKFPGKFQGFVEGDDITKGTVDVVVTDGFTGNIALKMAEGVAKFMAAELRQAFTSSLPAKIGYLLANRAMKRMKKKLDPRYYNGGIFMGLNGICIKSHGGSDSYGFSRAVILAADLVRNGFNERVSTEIESLMNQESFFSHDSLRNTF